MDIRHVYIRPRTPHLNGKVERSHRVDDQEFYHLRDKGGITDDIHLFNERLREWENYYNYHRPHGALDGQTSYERLIAKLRAGNVTDVVGTYRAKKHQQPRPPSDYGSHHAPLTDRKRVPSLETTDLGSLASPQTASAVELVSPIRCLNWPADPPFLPYPER